MTTASPSSDQVPLYGGAVHTHHYAGHDVTHSHDCNHHSSGPSDRHRACSVASKHKHHHWRSLDDIPYCCDGAGLVAEDPPIMDLVTCLPLWQDTHGYNYLQVGPDDFVCIGAQLLRAVQDKWPAASRAAVEEVGGKLVRLVADHG